MAVSEPREPTIADRISERLIAAIVEGEIPPGAKISEPDLARTYAVSRGPLREALRRIEGLHLIERRPHFGARVVALTAAQVGEIYEMREALEGMAARLAAGRMDADGAGRLHALLDLHETNIDEHDGELYFQREGDFDFHYRIIQASGNARLADYLCSELYHLVRMLRLKTSSPSSSRPRRALSEHRRIVDAIADADGELAEMLMRRHIARARDALMARLDHRQASST